MRRLALAALALAAPLAVAAPAAADHHLLKVREIATSYGPGNGQFVELKDDAVETFRQGTRRTRSKSSTRTAPPLAQRT
jgi:hypothetical protein